MAVSLAPQRQKLLTAVTTTGNTGTSAPVSVEGRESITIYFKSTGTTTGGTLFVEEADYDPADGVYSGTWSQISPTVTANDFTGTKQQAFHISPNAYNYIRVRVATNITGGGSVTAVLKMQ